MPRNREDEYQRVARELTECREALDLAEQSNRREHERAEALNRSCGGAGARNPESVIEAVEAEFNRIMDTADLDPERLGDETPEHYTARRAVETTLRACNVVSMMTLAATEAERDEWREKAQDAIALLKAHGRLDAI
jgi:hypothetical protein